MKLRSIKATHERILKCNNEASSGRQQSDAGQTIFNAESRREQVFTRLEYFKRLHRTRNLGEIFPDHELSQMYSALPQNEKTACEQGVLGLQSQAPFLASEVVGRLLRLMNGIITWRTLASRLAGGNQSVKPASHVTLMNFVMQLPDSSYSATWLLPMLTTGQISIQSTSNMASL
jgi:hypothetical protein